jgi:hypothetical protein
MSPQSPHQTIDIAPWITRRWTRGTRYYRAHLEQDLWRGWSLTRVYGRIGTWLGRARASPSLEVVLTALAAVTKRQRQHGYELTN